jgi:type II secretory pathway pseudopilin PulG
MTFRSKNERGVTYLFLMFVIVVIGLSTTMAAKQWKAMVQRELEADLLSKGIEIQNALALYSTTMKAGRVTTFEIYPQSLAELTRLPKPFLRKAYMDPMSHGDWDYLRGPTGGIMGVRSKSRATPFKQHEFPQAVRHFDGRSSLNEWIFQHPNPSTSGLLPVMPVPASPAPTAVAVPGATPPVNPAAPAAPAPAAPAPAAPAPTTAPPLIDPS